MKAKGRVCKIIFLLLLPVFPPALPLAAIDIGADFGEDAYGSFTDYLNLLYGIDDNAGLTSFPILNIPIGGRSEGMAGSFSAVADDISFMEQNPAASSSLKLSELAFFHNNWISDTNIEGVLYATRIGDLGLAAAGKWLYTPFTEYGYFGERLSKGYYVEAMGVFNLSYNFMAGYYFTGISAGMNLKAAYRFVPDYSGSDGAVVAGSGQEQSAFAYMADLGLLWRFDLFKGYQSREKNAALALTLRNLGPPVLEDPLPTVAVLGIAYKPIKPLSISLDGAVPLNLADISLSEKPYASLGIAVEAASFLSMRAGLLYKAGGIRFSVGSAVILETVSIDINYTLDLLTQFQPLNRVSVGARLNLGDQGRGAASAKVDELYLSGISAYSKGSLEEARRNWEEALALNPRFDPAHEGLEMLRRTESVETRMEQLRRERP